MRVSALTTAVTSRLYRVFVSLSFPDDLSGSFVNRRNVPASRGTNLLCLCWHKSASCVVSHLVDTDSNSWSSLNLWTQGFASALKVYRRWLAVDGFTYYDHSQEFCKYMYVYLRLIRCSTNIASGSIWRKYRKGKYTCIIILKTAGWKFMKWKHYSPGRKIQGPQKHVILEQ